MAMMLSKCGGKCCSKVPQEHSQPLYAVNILERLVGVWQDSGDFSYLCLVFDNVACSANVACV